MKGDVIMNYNERLRIARELIQMDARIDEQVKTQLYQDAILGEFYSMIVDITSTDVIKRGDGKLLEDILERLILDLTGCDEYTLQVHRYVRYKDIDNHRESPSQTIKEIIYGYDD